MLVPLILSSVASGLIATGVMVLFLYLPHLWGGDVFDVFGAIGSAITRRLSARAVVLGSLVFVVFGIVFAVLYGWLALALLNDMYPVPLSAGGGLLPFPVDLAYLGAGLAVGLAHGVIVALFVTIVIIEHHPLPHFHTRYILIVSQLVGHVIFGVVVMFFQTQFLQLFRAAMA